MHLRFLRKELWRGIEWKILNDNSSMVHTGEVKMNIGYMNIIMEKFSQDKTRKRLCR